MNALELADVLDRSVLALSADAAAELRRLYEVNHGLLEKLRGYVNDYMSEAGLYDAKYYAKTFGAAINKAEGRA